MTIDRSGFRLLAACAAVSGLIAASVSVDAQAASAKPAAKGTKSAKSVKKAQAPKAAEFIVPAASAEQIDAAERVYYGMYDCEFNQTIQIATSAKHPSYVDIKHGKAEYLMKPVLSSTGAIRLEDVRGETLMVQISAKSMLLNVKTARRLVDDCISPKQRELNEAARAAKAEEVAAAAAAAAAASAPAAMPAEAASGAAPASADAAASGATPTPVAAAASAPTPTPVAAAASGAQPTPAAAAASEPTPAVPAAAASSASGAETSAPK